MRFDSINKISSKNYIPILPASSYTSFKLEHRRDQANGDRPPQEIIDREPVEAQGTDDAPDLTPQNGPAPAQTEPDQSQHDHLISDNRPADSRETQDRHVDVAFISLNPHDQYISRLRSNYRNPQWRLERRAILPAEYESEQVYIPSGWLIAEEERRLEREIRQEIADIEARTRARIERLRAEVEIRDRGAVELLRRQEWEMERQFHVWLFQERARQEELLQRQLRNQWDNLAIGFPQTWTDLFSDIFVVLVILAILSVGWRYGGEVRGEYDEDIPSILKNFRFM